MGMDEKNYFYGIIGLEKYLQKLVEKIILVVQ